MLDNAEAGGFSDRTVQDIMTAVEEKMTDDGRILSNN
jgi:hypothetical protein